MEMFGRRTFSREEKEGEKAIHSIMEHVIAYNESTPGDEVEQCPQLRELVLNGSACEHHSHSSPLQLHRRFVVVHFVILQHVAFVHHDDIPRNLCMASSDKSNVMVLLA